MSAVVLAEITPRAAATGATTTVRLCWNARERANFLGQQWLPVITSLPDFETVLGYDGIRFGAGATPTVGQLQFALSPDTVGLAGMVWKGAAITLRRAAWRAGKLDPVDGDFVTAWSGRIDAASMDDGVVTLTMIDAGDVLRRPVIDRRFGTSGVTVLDATAAVAQRGKPVPMGWGRLEGVPCLLLDAADLIYLVVGQPADSVSAFYDGGAAFTLGTARADLAALRANVPAAGRVDYCLNAGGLCLARPWSRPVYPLTADLRVGTATAAAIAQALVTSRTSLGFVSGAIASLGSAQPADCELYIDDDTSLASALDRVLAGIGAVWQLTADGQVDVRQVTNSGTSVLTVASWARGRIRRQRLLMPARRFTLGYKPNWRLHSDGEIAQVLLAGDVVYPDGTPVSALQPAQAGATATAPADANRVAFSLMERDQGWAIIWNPAGRPVGTYYGTPEGRRVFLAQINPSASGQGLGVWSKQFRVTANERLSVQAFFGVENAGAASSTCRLAVRYFDDNGALLDETSNVGSFSGAISWRTNKVQGFATVPANARNAVVDCVAVSGGTGLIDMVISEPMVTSAIAAQNTHPTFTPGPNADDGATAGAPTGTQVAGADAATLVADAATAKANAASALSALSIISDDAYLSRDEKPAVRQQRDIVYAAFPIVAARADALSVSRTALNTAQVALWAYIDTLALDSATDTAISRATFNGRWSDYFNAQQDVLDRIAAKAATIANWSGVSGTGRPADNATVGAPSGTPVGAYGDAASVAPAILLASTTATWSGVSGTGRPADNATVGAPAGTPVAGVDAGTLVTDVAGKARTFNQADAPASPQIGWYWTVPGENAQRRWNGSSWELVLVVTGSAQVQAALAVPTSTTEQILFDQTLGVGPSGTVIVSGDLNYSPASGLGAASVQLELAAYYRTTPGSGSWNLMGSAQAGSTASRAADIGPGEPGPVTPGAVVLSRSIAGPGSTTNWQFQIRGRILSSTGSPGGAQGSGTGRVRWS